METVHAEPRAADRTDSAVKDRSTALSVGGCLFILLVGLAAYANTFHGSFNFDDTAVIRREGFAILWGPQLVPLLLKGWRAAGDLTFAVNYRLHGLDVVGYHVFNLAVHLATACLLFRLVTVTLRTPWCRRVASSPGVESDISRWGSLVAFASALLFVSHPVQTQAVTYIAQRYTSLATFFYVGSLLLYAQGRRAAAAGKGSRWTAIPLFGAALLAALLAMKTKQIAFTLPIMVVLYEMMFFTATLRIRATVVAAFLAACAAISFTIAGRGMASPELFDRLASVSRENALLSRPDYLFTQFRVIVTYIRLLFLPAGQRLDYDYTIYHAFWTPPVFLSFAALVLLLFLAVGLVRTSHRWGDARGVDAVLCRLAGFGIFWFFIALAVESSIIPISDVIVEHRLYLPSVGAFIAVVASVCLVARRFRGERPRLVTALCVVFLAAGLLLGGATFLRNRVWATEVSLWEDNVAKTPNLSRPLNNLATAYIRQNEPLRALAILLRANALAPGYTDTWINICIALDRLGTYGDRFRYGKEFVDERGTVKPQHLTEWFSLASNNLGLAYAATGEYRAAIRHYEKALRLAPNLPEAHLNLGLAFLAIGEERRAVEELRTVNNLNPALARKMVLWFRGREQGANR